MTKRQFEDFSDDQLMANLARGEVSVLEELYYRYDTLVRKAIVRCAPEISLAKLDEVVQDVFLVINKIAERYEERQKLQAWIYGIAARKARTWRRNTWLRRNLL